MTWEDGSEFTAGCEYYRINDKGEYVSNSIYEDQSNMVVELRSLIENNTPETIFQAIEEKIKVLVPFEQTPLKGNNVKRFIKEA